MKQELIDTTIDLYTISRKIKEHNFDFNKKYPKIQSQLDSGDITESISIMRLLLNELSSFKIWSR